MDGSKFRASRILGFHVDTDEEGELSGQLFGGKMQTTFDLERYLNNSRKVETRDLDFSHAREYPLTSEEIRCLTYMMDVESHTIIRRFGHCEAHRRVHFQTAGIGMVRPLEPHSRSGNCGLRGVC